jgi:signal transduction histidine kinase/phage shock protein PspC (stress-responsive transcriptional regulator)
MATPATAPTRRLYRRRDGRLVAGVSAGLADHLGIDLLVLRIGFVVTVVLGGLGVLLYAAFWAVVPLDDTEPQPVGAKASRSQLVAFAGLGLVVLVAAQLLGFGPGVLWPTAVAVTGGAILWRQADETSRLRWRALATGEARGATLVRYALGLLLVVIGMVTFLAAQGRLDQARRALLPVLVVVVGVLIVIGPWLLRAIRQRDAERTARIREQERVEIAGRVHDSMLQTLTLIQRRADDPTEVRRLVRHSERELRGWLYAPAAEDTALRAVLTAVCGDVEDEYGVTIDLVVVGEHPGGPPVQPFVRALREAAINAAKHSGTKEFAVYVEVAADQLVGFVRDRGQGFDVDAVPTDRFGVRESVVARMQRHGGDAVIRSSPGTGTEIRLSLPLETSVAT